MTLRYLKGTEMYLANTLSRTYFTDVSPSAFMEELTLINATESGYLSAVRLEDIAEHSKKDPVLVELERMNCSGWQEKKDDVSNLLDHSSTFVMSLLYNTALFTEEKELLFPSS